MYDMTHDNPSAPEKFGNFEIMLPHLVINGMCSASIGSTFGYDDLYPKNLSVVTEERGYHIYEPNEAETNKFYEVHQSHSSHDSAPKVLSHTFKLKYRDASQVSLALDFNSWVPNVSLTRHGDEWTVTLDLPCGDYQYKYVINNTNWIIDSSAPQINDGHGNINN